MKKRPFIIAALSLSLISSAPAAVVITFAEKPGEVNTPLVGTDVFTFDNVKTGMQTDVSWKGVGSFDQLFIKKADIYGGAPSEFSPKGSLYSVQGVGTKVLSSTLTLDEASSYFGLWWSAGDAQNVLQFYNRDALVAEFTTASLLAPLPKDYYGNPINTSWNRGEPYAFINFYGDADTSWDRIVLRNNGSSGFESDNYTTRVAAWDPMIDGALPGVPVAIVEGTKTTTVTQATLEGTRWSLDETTAGAVPGAPVPPWTLLFAFGFAVAMRRLRQDRAMA
jgi:hypothetical protein